MRLPRLSREQKSELKWAVVIILIALPTLLAIAASTAPIAFPVPQ